MSSLLFPLIFHPLIIGIIIIFLTLIISIHIWITLNHPWLAYILFLVFLGALLVLFIYISTLAPNEKFIKLSYYPLLILFLTPLLPHQKINKDITIIEVDFLPSIKLFSLSLSIITLFIALYLFLTLIIISKITLFKEGPLRTITYVLPPSENTPYF